MSGASVDTIREEFARDVVHWCSCLGLIPTDFALSVQSRDGRLYVSAAWDGSEFSASRPLGFLQSCLTHSKMRTRFLATFRNSIESEFFARVGYHHSEDEEAA
jgi:hypothetical protein